MAWGEAPPRTRAGSKPRVPARSLSPVFGGLFRFVGAEAWVPSSGTDGTDRLARSTAASVTMWLGWITLGLGVVSTMGILALDVGPAHELEGAGLWEVAVGVFVPYALGPCLALGSIGAAFAEGVARRTSIAGMALATLGAGLPWLTWAFLCCQA